MQGRLRNQVLSVAISTQCAHCGRAMHFEIDSDMKCRVREEQADPLVFLPNIDWATFQDPSIIHGY